MPNNVTKPPILDNTGQTIKQKLSAILSALQSATSAFIPLTQKGAASGVAELDANGKVPSSQLPSYVDDVLEYASLSDFPATGEAGKIYIATDTNKSYRWSGSTYVEISSSLALGETSSTAYRGDRGKIAYDHATESGKISAAVASGLYKIAATAEGHIASLTAVQKSDLTALGVADADNIPTKTSDLTNDSGFVTESEVEGAKTVQGNPITLPDAAPINAESLVVDLGPIQDLHGYDNPWVGGAGKNKLKLLEGSTTGATVNVAYGNNGVVLNGTATGTYGIKVCDDFVLPAGNYILNGCPSGGGYGKYSIEIATMTGSYTPVGLDIGNGVSFTANGTDSYRVVVYVYRQYGQYNNFKLYPMIRLSTETDATFVPYTNICPITGYTEVSVDRVGKNLFDGEYSNAVLANIDSSTMRFSSNSTGRCAIVSAVGGNTYTISKNSGNRLYVCESDEYPTDGNIYHKLGGADEINEITITISSTAKYLLIYVSNNSVEPLMQVEQGSTATPYEPYHSSNATIQLDRTVYGGTVDFTKGVCVIDSASIVYDGSSDENWWKYGQGSASAYCMVISAPNAVKLVKCNELQIIPTNATWGNYDAFIVKDGTGVYTGVRSITTSADWKIYLASNPLHIVYELATPIEIHLTPKQLKLLQGINHISSNGTEIELTYQPDNVLGEILENVEGQLSDTGWEKISISSAVPSTSADPYLYYRKKAGIVEVTLPIQSYTTEAGTDVQIATLPQGFRPKIRIASASYENGADANYLLIMQSGEVILHRTASYQGYNMVFFAD